MDTAATLWTKDPNSESDFLINAIELDQEAVFGRLEEPLIVAPELESQRGNSYVERSRQMIDSVKGSKSPGR